MERRQQIGRGLRLPVNEHGERVHDETVNRLTVIASEGYEEFARALQKEFEDDCGITFGKIDKIAFAKLVRPTPEGKDEAIGQKQSGKIWQELKANGYINETGEILNTFDPKNPHFSLKISDEYLNNLYTVQNQEKCLFDAIEYDSEVEKEFAKDLDSNEFVKMFVKLPSWFKIDTPIGPYNPDWAFVTERDEKLYFVRETKSTTDSEERRNKENQKIHCGKKHFETIGADFAVVTKLSEVKF